MSIVAAVQMTSADDVHANLRAAGRLLEQARDAGAVLALLPENFALMSAREGDKLTYAEEEGRGPIQDFLAAAAQRLKLWIVAGTVPLHADAAHVYAASLVFDASGRRVGRYDKMHLFDVQVPGGSPGDTARDSPTRSGREAPENYRESATIAPGAESFQVIASPAGRLGLSVCYDLRFPELYRALAARGAEVLLVPSAFTARTGRAHWEVLLRARAVENQCFVLASNQCGEHPGGRRTFGHSCIVDPWGQILAQRDEGEGVSCADVSLQRLHDLRRSFPVLTHQRIHP